MNSGRHKQRLGLVATVMYITCGPQIGSARADDFQVNTYTTSSQRNPSVAQHTDGRFIVVWDSDGSGGTDSESSSVQGQRYASDGSLVGAQFQVNAYTASSQGFPWLAMAADGDFVVVWRSAGSDGTDSDSSSIQGQRYASDGSPTGAQFQVNTYTTSHQFDPRVAMGADGDFVVVWGSYGSSGTDSDYQSVQAQRFASDGSALGGQFQVNTYTTGYQYSASVALAGDGDFVIVWHSTGSAGTDSSVFSIQGQRYSSGGTGVGREFQINTYTTDWQRFPSVAMAANGDFVIVWQSRGSSGTDTSDYFNYSVQGQRYAPDGSAVGGEFQVNTYTTDLQGMPAVAVDVDGNFVVVWSSYGSTGTDSDDQSVQGQHYASDGSIVGGEFQVNTYTTGDQVDPSLSMATDSFVVVWGSEGSGGADTDGNSVQGRRFVVPLFADGFESGDSSSWSNVVP